MSNYYRKKDAKVNIAHYLMSKDWQVLGYSADQSDSMTDYYCPAHWGGVAIKNGFILVVDNDRPAEEYQIKKYNYTNTSYTDQQKIAKLEQMTTSRGATEGEEQNAKDIIEKIKNKESEGKAEFEIIGVSPAHLANPTKAMWHIEKGGKIYDKGNALTKFADLPASYMYDIDKMEFTEHYKTYNNSRWIDGEYITTKEIRTLAEDEQKAVTEFKKLMERIEKIANSEIKLHDGTEEGHAEGIQQEQKQGYEKVIVTEYKTEIKATEIEKPDTIQKDMYFKLKVNFNHGCVKGIVYKINDVRFNQHTNKYYVDANRLNRKLTKVLTGYASSENRFNAEQTKFEKWIDENSIVFVKLEEVKTPCEVEKWVKISKAKTPKKTPKTEEKADPTPDTEAPESTDKPQIIKGEYTYKIIEDIDTRNNNKIFVVKIVEKLQREKYLEQKAFITKLGSYYSGFKNGFIFRKYPEKLLQYQTN